MESSRRYLLNDMAEHRSIFKNNQNTFNPNVIFTPKTGKNTLKQVSRFACKGKSSPKDLQIKKRRLKVNTT